MASTPLNNYPYRPLDGARKEIRVLRPIESGALSSNDTLLRFEVSTVSLLEDQNPQFYAVSYAWGERPSPARAILDGQECTIPDSAEAALRGLLTGMAITRMDCSMPIWIDAVCINQGDLREKSQQVAGMGNVFANASSVLVWLGADDGTAKTAITTVKALADECLKWTDGEDELEANDQLPYADKYKLPYWYESAPEGCDIRSLESLLGCRYFSRLWVFQEIVLAKQVNCFQGVHHIDWHLFSLAARWAYHRVENLRPGKDLIGILNNLSLVRNIHELRQSGQKIDLQYFDEYFDTIITLKATEPRDKIFALLGLVDGTDHNSIGRPILIADYDKALVDIYTEAILLAIQHSADPQHVLLVCQQRCVPTAVNTSWPSWVPQLHLIEHNLFLATAHPDTRAGSARSAIIGAHPSNVRVLQVTGIVFDEIQHLWPPLAIDQDDIQQVDSRSQARLYRHFAYLWHTTFVEQTGLVWSKEVLLALARCIMSCSYEDASAQLKDIAAFLNESRRYCTEDIDPVLSSLMHDIGTDGDSQSVLEWVSDLGSGVFPLFMTEDGRFGLCGKHVEEGDYICALYGARQPFVMRKWGDFWKLRGTCHLPSVGNENWEMAIEKIEPQVFNVN